MIDLRRQKEIYTAGSAGLGQKIPLDYASLRLKAQSVMSHKAFTYIDGGAGTDSTIRRNSGAFEACGIVPRMLTGIEAVDTSARVLSYEQPVPFMFAPIGVLELAHREADLGVASAASQSGIPMIFSSQGSVPMEAAAKACGDTPYYFQLYWSKSDELVRSFVSRAADCGCRGIFVTLDTTVLGWRTRDLGNGYLPFLDGYGIAQYTSDPVFQRMVDEMPKPGRIPGQPLTLSSIGTLLKMSRVYPGSTWTNLRSRRALKGVRKFIDIYSNPALSWEHIERLRNWTDLPIILKGIIHPDDAARAVALGVDGIVVSNHGGRQVDGSVSTFEMLPDITEAVNGKLEIIIDSGVRTGADVFKCLAAGADCVLIGRPFAFALAVGGTNGVVELMDNLREELALTMILSGCASIDDISTDHIKMNK